MPRPLLTPVKMYKICFMVTIFTFFCTSIEACAENDNCQINLDDKNIQAIIKGTEDFQQKLMFNVFTNTIIKGNVAFSPLCIYFSLVLLLLGSNDSTLSLLNEVLGVPQDMNWAVLKADLAAIINVLEVTRSEQINGKKVIYEKSLLGLAIFFQKTYYLQDSYRNFLETINAKYVPVDFSNQQQTADTISQWVYALTNADVSVQVKGPFPESSELFVASGVFFSSSWARNLFSDNNHSTGNFESYSNGIVSIGTMKTTAQLAFFDDQQSFSCLQLPYRGETHTMLLVLPYKNVDINDFVQKFTVAQYKTIIAQSYTVKVTATVPTFVGTWAATMGYTLRQMNLEPIFDFAQLNNMIANLGKGRSVKLAEMLHAAGIVLNESGTTVSTVAGDTMFGASLISTKDEVEKHIHFTIDRPFMMFIHNVPTGMAIYSGLMREF